MTAATPPAVSGSTIAGRVWDYDERAWMVPTVKCPRCKGHLLYNGNYFCPRFTRLHEICWVLGENNTPFARAIRFDFYRPVNDGTPLTRR